MFLRLFGLYRSACFGSLFVSILCTCCSHFSWYCFISFTMFCAPVFCLIHCPFLYILLNSASSQSTINNRLSLYDVPLNVSASTWASSGRSPNKGIQKWQIFLKIRRGTPRAHTDPSEIILWPRSPAMAEWLKSKCMQHTRAPVVCTGFQIGRAHV